MKELRRIAGVLGCAMLMASVHATEPTFIHGSARSGDAAEIASEFMRQVAPQLGLKSEDLESRISDRYISPKSGVTHVYLQQLVNGIPVTNAITTINILRDGRVLNPGYRFVADTDSKANSVTPAISAIDAINVIARHFSVAQLRGITPESERSGVQQAATYAGGNLSAAAIPTELVYESVGSELRLAWRVVIDRYAREQKLLDMRIDANTGEILGISNWVAHGGITPPDHTAGYRVYSAPFESPGHPGATAALVTNPFDLAASPRGWHDSRATGAGPEFTDTRGNNVTAQADLIATNASSTRPSGSVGPNLVFDSPLNDTLQPTVTGNVDAAVTNLFYWNNFIHDVLWHYDFNEAAGNFQINNFGRGGAGNDGVQADALDGASLVPPNANNANFGTPPDGSPGRMQMFRWLAPAPINVNVTAPFTNTYVGQGATFGGTIAAQIVNNIVVVNDGVAADSGRQGCVPLVNAAAVSGRVALIKRGGCEFGVKALTAQNAGAIAAIVYNNQGEVTIAMGPGASGASVTIPALMIVQSAGEAIAAAAPPVSATIDPPTPIGADRDSDFDAGIMGHEYGHGVSNRLTGGPSQVGCLQNEEQGGEGWSDFIGMILTMDANSCAVPRSIGTYPSFQPVAGPGIRRFPYTTNMTINPFTYTDVANPLQSLPHGVGSVWATMIWDMTCKLVERDGFDADVKNGTGGNNMGMQLVMDGMKLQPCSPSFVDARDGILAADVALNGGSNQCLIWQAFARRGLGFTANAGLSSSRSDGVAAFDLPEACLQIFKNGFE